MRCDPYPPPAFAAAATGRLTSLSNEKKIEVWEQVQERAVETHEPVTASLIKEVKAGSSAVPVKKHTFTKTFARVVHDYREALLSNIR